MKFASLLTADMDRRSGFLDITAFILRSPTKPHTLSDRDELQIGLAIGGPGLQT